MVYTVSETTRHKARALPSAGHRRRASRAAGRTLSLQWPPVIALGLNVAAWIGIIAAARWVFHL